MRKFLLFQILFVCLASVVFAQSDSAPSKKGFSAMIGGSYGIFDPRHAFIDVYGYQIPQLCGQAALGYNNGFVIGKYRNFKASGNSKVQNITITTNAEWREEILAVGFRACAESSPFYYDLLYITMKANETITTISPKIPELTASNAIQEHGIGFAVGFAPPLIGPLGIFLECEWDYMFPNDMNNAGVEIPGLGGLFTSCGFHFTIN